MSTSNGKEPDRNYENRLAAWNADHAEKSVQTQRKPKTYKAEKVKQPHPLIRALLGPAVMRRGYGAGRVFPRAEWLWRWLTLASVLTLGLWAVAESRAARHASERSEAWQRFIAAQLKETTDADSGMRQRGSEGRGDSDIHHRADQR